MRKRALSLLAWTAVLLLALAVRAAPLTAGRPYINYVDEGNFLHPVAALLRTGGWDPRWYMYPQLPVTAVTAAARLYAPVYCAAHGRDFREGLPRNRRIHDLLEPFELLLIGRLLSLLAGLGIVVLTGLFARRLAGPRAGLFAAFLAALVPPLAIRGAIATVDPYAAFFVLACLFFTDRARTSSRPGLDSFAAGAMAGCAFASKYPAILVILSFALTVLLERLPWRDRLRRWAAAAAGVGIGTGLAMPAVLLHPRDVWLAMRHQAELYAGLTSPPLWRQALVRAEWDLPYEHPELGAVYLALTLVGFAVALRDRRLAKTVWGWVLLLALCLVLYLPQGFQPFRNLLPLVPLSCLAVTILLIRIRERLPRPLWADLGAATLVLLLFGVHLAGYARERYRLADSRTEAMDWLAERTAPGDFVLLLRELAFHKQELARMEGTPLVRLWPKALEVLRTRRPRPRFLVAGILQRPGAEPLDLATVPAIHRHYALKARFGEGETLADLGWWRGNRQTVYVFEAKPPRRKRADLP